MLKSKLYNDAGSRNQEIVVQFVANETQNNSGDVTILDTDWQDYCTRFAAAEPTTGREFMAARQIEPLLQSIYKLPYDEKTAQITPRMRIKNGSRIVNIAGVWNEQENNEKIVIWTTEPIVG